MDSSDLSHQSSQKRLELFSLLIQPPPHPLVLVFFTMSYLFSNPQGFDLPTSFLYRWSQNSFHAVYYVNSDFCPHVFQSCSPIHWILSSSTSWIPCSSKCQVIIEHPAFLQQPGCQIPPWPPPTHVCLCASSLSSPGPVTTLSHGNYCGRFLIHTRSDLPETCTRPSSWSVRSCAKRARTSQAQPPIDSWCLIILALFCSILGSCQCWWQICYHFSHYTTSKQRNLIPNPWL